MLIDLTATLTPETPGVSWESAKDLKRDGWNARLLHLYSHSGTHMDAPRHFGCSHEIGTTIDELPLETFLGPARVVHLDVSAGELLQPAHLGELAADFVPGQALLLQTGWAAHRGNLEVFRNQLPRVSVELARWCVEKKVRVLGVEPPSVADVNDLAEVTKIHEVLLSGGVTIVEGLINLDQLPGEEEFTLGAFPLKIEGGDGSPCRAFAHLNSY
ncbi:cyclase family protein [Roseibacillus persicicus]|uniref:cyclase family protein n=1 Tax=Roseibacillus persicicus TaxID=454148 RepID=UPI00280FFD4A|nr:cyclase family protein [Roseibacillus persicicus]MDQ8189851.1 cyclase family protein [Roseibacillus persicicus]